MIRARVGLAILAVVFAVALLVPLLGYDPAADAEPTRANLSPGLEHWLGTDHNGRDVFSRLLLAARSFAGPGLLACAVALLLGVPLGASAGYRGGWVEHVARYVFAVISSLPRFVLVLLVATIYGDALWVLALAAGVAYAPTVGEDVFARIEALRGADYVVANRAHGLPEWRILWVHLVWAACRRRIARHALTLFAYFLVLEATLSYLGQFGPLAMPSWGNMLTHDLFQQEASWVTVAAPAAAIWLVVAAATWVREGLREVGGD